MDSKTKNGEGFDFHACIPDSIYNMLGVATLLRAQVETAEFVIIDGLPHPIRFTLNANCSRQTETGPVGSCFLDEEGQKVSESSPPMP